MTESKSQVEAQRDALLAENERLKGELAAARAGGASPAMVTLAASPDFLSEGDRQALEMNGVVSRATDGKLLLASDHGIEVKTAAGRANLARAQQEAEESPRDGIRGVDYVYPSVARGVLDPAASVRGAQPASAVEQDAPASDDASV